MSFRRKEDSRYQITFDETNENNYSNGIDFANKSSAEISNLFDEVLQSGMHGLCFSLYVDGQKPGDIISEEQVRRRMKIIAPHTKWIPRNPLRHQLVQMCTFFFLYRRQ